MKKKIWQAFIFWLVLFLILAGTAFWTESQMVMAGAGLWVLIPVCSTLCNLHLRKQIQITTGLPVSVSKREKMTGTVTVHNHSRFLAARLSCEVMVKNQLTQEKVTEWIFFSVGASKTAEKNFTLVSEHCGYISVRPVSIWLLDWIGFLPVRGKLSDLSIGFEEEKNGAVVLPDTFQPHLYLNPVQTVCDDAQDWSQTQKGNDLSEVFSIRDYVPGDSLKQIHWKLSSKRGQLIVREASLPVEKSLLLFWDKTVTGAQPVEVDALAECAASVAQSMLNQGYRFTLGWTEESEIMLEQIESEEDLFQTIPEMIRHGAKSSDAEKRENLFVQKAGAFGKVIYLAKTVGKEMDYFPCKEMTCLVCEKTAHDRNCRVVTFRADHYEEDLAEIEL